MTVELRTPDQIAKMRVAGRMAAEVLEMIGDYVVPGVTTEELDRICHEHIVNIQKAIPACLGYRGFPKSEYGFFDMLVDPSLLDVYCHLCGFKRPPLLTSSSTPAVANLALCASTTVWVVLIMFF